MTITTVGTPTVLPLPTQLPNRPAGYGRDLRCLNRNRCEALTEFRNRRFGGVAAELG